MASRYDGTLSDLGKADTGVSVVGGGVGLIGLQLLDLLEESSPHPH